MPAVPWRVLIADDNVEIRDLIRYGLELDGRFEVVAEASNGERAIRMAADFRPDAVVLDVAMPVMGGLEALPLIRKVLGDQVVAVILSGLDRDVIAAHADQLDALFVPKLEACALSRRLATLCLAASSGSYLAVS